MTQTNLFLPILTQLSVELSLGLFWAGSIFGFVFFSAEWLAEAELEDFAGKSLFSVKFWWLCSDVAATLLVAPLPGLLLLKILNEIIRTTLDLFVEYKLRCKEKTNIFKDYFVITKVKLPISVHWRVMS